MKWLLSALIPLAVTSCATAPIDDASQRALLRDDLFPAARPDVSRANVFAVSSEMRAFLQRDIGPQLREKGKQQGLIDALYRGELRIDYDAGITYNAAETFSRRSGNCLSLAVLTGAIARELGLDVHYQSVVTDESWGRGEGLYFTIGHVNVVIGSRVPGKLGQLDDDTVSHTIDFMPQAVLGKVRTRPIGESRVAAMYMNNRAAESLLVGKTGDAYWWARQALLEDPDFVPSVNTLGVVYRRTGQIGLAEAAFRHVLQRETDNAHALSNLALVLSDAGRADEARSLQARLERVQPYAPFHFFNLGRAAFQRGDLGEARGHFQRELDRNPYSAETHFWLAAVYVRDGNLKRAQAELQLAHEYSATRQDRELYSAKMERLQTYRR